MKATLKAELEAAFRDVLTRMPNQFTTQEAVDALRAEYPDLWQTSGDVLVIELLREMASRILRRPDATAVNPDQLRLPGFEHLPRLIRFKGRYIAIEESNLTQLLDFQGWYDTRLQILIKRTEKFQETGRELSRLIRLMERFSDGRPDITVRTALKLHGEKSAARLKLDPDERREIGKKGGRPKKAKV